MTITLAIVVLTCVVSFIGFSNEKIINDLIFYPPAVANQNQWYRFVTCGFIHADLTHLAFNMFSFFVFGKIVETAFVDLFADKGMALYLAMYLLALVICLLPTYFKNKENYGYRSLGASGAVSAVIFVGIFLDPSQKVGILFIPIPIPGYLFGLLYLIFSAYMSKRGANNINHSAHFWGAIFGLIYIIALCFALTNYNPIIEFVSQIKSSSN